MSTTTVAPGASQTGRPRQRVTISDVARELGLTKGTVSRALNGYTDISDETRLRVKRIADKLGYRPLSHAQAIRTGRARSLGLVLQIDDEDSARPFLADFIAGITQAASAEDWSVTISAESSVEAVGTAMARLADEKKADGFILPRSLLDDTRVETLRAENIPFVMFGRTRNPTGCSWFDIKGEDAMGDAVQRLADHGHKRIGHIPGGSQFTYAALRVEGFKQGLNNVGHQADKDLIGKPATTRQAGYQSALELLSQAIPPTALVCATDRAALGVYRLAEDLGLTIGRELSLISYDGIPEGSYANPGLTTFSVDSRQAGKRLAELLIARIRGTAPDKLRELASAKLIKRGSDRPPTMTSDQLALHVSEFKSIQNVQWEDLQ